MLNKGHRDTDGVKWGVKRSLEISSSYENVVMAEVESLGMEDGFR